MIFVHCYQAQYQDLNKFKCELKCDLNKFKMYCAKFVLSLIKNSIFSATFLEGLFQSFDLIKLNMAKIL